MYFTKTIFIILFFIISVAAYTIINVIQYPWLLIPILLFIITIFVFLINICYCKCCDRRTDTRNQDAIFVVTNVDLNHTTNQFANLHSNNNQISAPSELPPPYEVTTCKPPSYQDVINNKKSHGI